MDKRVLIAGADDMLHALARAFLEEGDSVALLTPDAKSLEQALDVLGGEQADRFGLVAGEGALDKLLGRLGRLDVLVCAPRDLGREVSLERRLAQQVAEPSGWRQPSRQHGASGARCAGGAIGGRRQSRHLRQLVYAHRGLPVPPSPIVRAFSPAVRAGRLAGKYCGWADEITNLPASEY